MRKGFLHVMETIIVSLLVFVLAVQFSGIPGTRTDWARSKLTLMGNDLLYSLDRSGINWFNETEVSARLDEALPPTMGYSLRARLSARPVIRVGCVCDERNFTMLKEEILTGFYLNGIRRDFIVEMVDPSSFPVQEDVIIFWGYRDLDAKSLNRLKGHLNSGGGVVEISNPDQAKVGDQFHSEILNLEWVSDSFYTKSAAAEFSPSQPSGEIYQVEKLFYGTPHEITESGDFSGSWRFNDGAGGTARDSSPNRNDGALRDSSQGDDGQNPPPRWVEGRFGPALRFDGNDDYVAINDMYYIRPGQIQEITVCAWVKSSSPSNQIIMSFDRDEYWRLALNDDTGTGNVGWDTADAGGLVHDLGTVASYSDGNWHFICGWFMEGADPDKKIFVDGTAVASAKVHSGGLGTGTKRYGFIGVGSDADVFDGQKGPLYYFDGTLDEVMVLNRALSSSEILDMYMRTIPPNHPLDNFIAANVTPRDGKQEKIVVRQKNQYYYSGQHSGKSVPLATINYNIEGRGRSAWMSMTAPTPEVKQLARSLVIWSAGGRDHEILPGVLGKSVTSRLYKTFNYEMFEPAEIDLTIGYYY